MNEVWIEFYCIDRFGMIIGKNMSERIPQQIVPLQQPRSKSLPSLELIKTLELVCESTPNFYDSKNHALFINDWHNFVDSLRLKLSRSVQSFEKQLKMAGFRKQSRKMSNHNNDDYNEDDGVMFAKYHWRGKKEDCITQELSFLEKNVQNALERGTALRQKLNLSLENLDFEFTKAIFSIMTKNKQEASIAEKKQNLLKNIKKVVNFFHRETLDAVKGTQKIMETQIQMLRLLSYKQENPQ